jgi:hypothetical protein
MPMADILSFPAARSHKQKPDSVWIVLDLGRWCAAAYFEERLARRFPANPNTFDAAHALAKDMAERDGLRFVETSAPAIQTSEAADD